MDWYERERKFRITKTKGKRSIFNCDIKLDDGRFIENACMNSLGIFSNIQILHPNNEIKKIPKKRNSMGGIFFQSQNYATDVNDLVRIIGDKPVYTNVKPGLHNMYADINGNAIVLEASENGNEISYIKDNYIVMTNFPVYEFREKHYSKVSGIGSDRYIIAHKEIIKHKNNFGIKQGFNVLKKAKNTSKHSPTVCSLIFDPIESNVYFVLFSIFEKIWKVSILDNTIETYKGFDKQYKSQLGSRGITSSELEKIMYEK
jgi:hypothetical protein